MATALITGANRGIGLALAREFSAFGVAVIGTSRSLENATELSSFADVRQLDVTDLQSIHALAQDVSGIDILVNNAGDVRPRLISTLTDESYDDFERKMRVNVIGAFEVTKALEPKLTSDAKIINVSSRLGSLTNVEAVDIAYAVSKAALNMLTRQLAKDELFRDRTVVAMNPGWVRTRGGGDTAPLSLEESILPMAKTILSLQHTDTGTFIDRFGKTIPF